MENLKQNPTFRIKLLLMKFIHQLQYFAKMFEAVPLGDQTIDFFSRFRALRVRFCQYLH